jgi:hypothetical protein
MNICVVTPYFETPAAWLTLCHRSVRAQGVPTTHILVCDGATPTPIPDFQGIHVVLRRNYADYGNTPRFIGCFQALTAGADAIAFLDADNWYYPEHLSGLLAHAQANDLDACSSTRMLHRLDGSLLIRCPHVNGTEAIDTNCLLVMAPAFRHLVGWVLAAQDQAAVTDQIVWRYLRQMGARTGFLDRATVGYRTRHRVHYEIAGESPPPEAVRRADTHGARYQ